VLVILGGELPISEQRDGVTCAPGVKLDPLRKDVGRDIRLVPELNPQNVSSVMPWRRRYERSGPQRRSRDRKAFWHLQVPPPADTAVNVRQTSAHQSRCHGCLTAWRNLRWFVRFCALNGVTWYAIGRPICESESIQTGGRTAALPQSGTLVG